MQQQQILVVLGYVEHDGKVLLSQRNEPTNPAVHLVWEFPGGTNHFGETLEQTCVRELKEELGVDVEPLELFPRPVSHTWDFGERHVQIHLVCFRCRYVGGEPTCLEEEINDVRWVPKAELSKYNFFETGRKFVEQIGMLNVE
ncbi:NUDIX domain-containing protein [Candidatus Uhrbacteria bacterium]|nr:NUDIX domain-containing protein [Candidatus Uhrbacteria bacterium]